MALLSDAEKTYYDLVFSYAMETVEPDKTYDWESYGGKGSITIEKTFVSKSGGQCRYFSENYIVRDHKGAERGVGCKRVGRDGWCKLKEKDAALTCALEVPSYGVSLPSGNVNGINAPSAPAIGSVGSPNVNPDVNTNVNPNVDTRLDNKQKNKTTAGDVADTVTDSAGRAAGTATGGAIKWFSDTFR